MIISKLTKLMALSVLTSLFLPFSAQAQVRGRTEVAPLYMNIRLKQSGKTIKKYDMGGARYDLTLLPCGENFCGGYLKGVTLKPFVFGGGGNQARIVSLGVMLGHYTPITKCLVLLPEIGVTHTRFWGNNFGVQAPEELGGVRLDAEQKFHSVSFVLGGEAIYTINDQWVVTFIYNYGWAHTNSVIRTKFMGQNLPPTHSHGSSSGSNFALVIDYYFNNCWSISAGAGYNLSLSKERHGLSGVGAKLGIARIF